MKKEIRISDPQTMEKIARYFNATFSEDTLEHHTLIIEEDEDAVVMYIHEIDHEPYTFNHAENLNEAMSELILFDE